MSWPPDGEKKVLDVTGTVQNILDYIDEFDDDALVWAGATGAGFVRLFPNAPGRLIDKFPTLVCLNQHYATDLTGDLLQAGLELTFEGAVSGPKLDDLVLETKKYAMAVESMLANIPSEDLNAGAKNVTIGSLIEIGTDFDITGQLQTANAFIALFRTKAVYKMDTSAF